jgi:hypothetical protein
MRNYKYKYELMKGSRRYICPKCQKKEFKVYVKTGTNIVVDETKYGRCNRQDACRYHLYPKLGKDDINSSRYVPPAPEEIKPLDFVSKDLMQATFNEFKSNVFFMWLVKMFGIEKAYQLQEAYNIGTAKGGGIIFWQEDRKGNVRTGKVMYYHPNGKRIKERNSWFVHKKIKDDFNYRQCFFGLHLTTPDKPVALCESEKTAIIMSVFEPSYTWIASGGSEMLNDERLFELPRLDKVFADNGQFEKWERKTRAFEPEMDISVDNAVNNGILKEGDDILDLYLAKEKKNELNLAI